MPLRLNDCKREFHALRRGQKGINKFYFLSYRPINQNVFVKPNEQSSSSLEYSAMARKRLLKTNSATIMPVLLSLIVKIGGGVL